MDTRSLSFFRIISSANEKTLAFLALGLFLALFPMVAHGAVAVDLAWDANTEPHLAGYKIYYGTASGVYSNSIDVGDVTQYTLAGLIDGVTYYIAATAYDVDDHESGYSVELVHTTAIANHTITASAGANGSISPSGSITVSNGSNQSFTISADATYDIQNVLVDGVSVGAVSTYSFANVTQNHTIQASFAINTHTIAATAGANGSISPPGSVTVNHGSNRTFTINADFLGVKAIAVFWPQHVYDVSDGCGLAGSGFCRDEYFIAHCYDHLSFFCTEATQCHLHGLVHT